MAETWLNPCTICGKPGLPGLVVGCGKCQYHWNVGIWGKPWVDKMQADAEKGACVMTDQAKKPTDFTINQRVRARAGTSLFDRGCREGNVYYIGKELVNVEFDYLGTVAAVYPDEIVEIT